MFGADIYLQAVIVAVIADAGREQWKKLQIGFKIVSEDLRQSTRVGCWWLAIDCRAADRKKAEKNNA